MARPGNGTRSGRVSPAVVLLSVRRTRVRPCSVLHLCSPSPPRHPSPPPGGKGVRSGGFWGFLSVILGVPGAPAGSTGGPFPRGQVARYRYYRSVIFTQNPNRNVSKGTLTTRKPGTKRLPKRPSKVRNQRSEPERIGGGHNAQTGQIRAAAERVH